MPLAYRMSACAELCADHSLKIMLNPTCLPVHDALEHQAQHLQSVCIRAIHLFVPAGEQQATAQQVASNILLVRLGAEMFWTPFEIACVSCSSSSACCRSAFRSDSLVSADSALALTVLRWLHCCLSSCACSCLKASDAQTHYPHLPLRAHEYLLRLSALCLCVANCSLCKYSE